MVFKVYEEKIRLIFFIRSLGEESLSRQVFEQQKLKKWPGLCKETAKICLELGIEDVNLTNLSKDKYMKLFLEACHKKNEEKLRTLATGKCSRIRKKYIRKKIIYF